MTPEQEQICSYSFSLDEIKELVVLMRKSEAELSDTMAHFQRWLENELYSNMTLEEAAGFFNEKK